MMIQAAGWHLDMIIKNTSSRCQQAKVYSAFLKTVDGRLCPTESAKKEYTRTSLTSSLFPLMMTSRKSSTWNSGVNNTILVVLFGSKETKVREISTNSF